MIPADVAEFHRALQRPADVIACKQALSAFLAARGYTAFTYAGIRAQLAGPRNFEQDEPLDDRPIYVTTVRADWEAHYLANGYQHQDPVILAARRQVTPIIWNGLAINLSPLPGSDLVLRASARFGVDRGFAVPIHGPEGEFGLLSAYLDPASPGPHDVQSPIDPALHAAAIHFHAAIQDAARRTVPVPQPVSLTPREIECLLWIARGKSTEDVAAILEIARDTVSFHCKNAMAKLNVTSRPHAIAKMIQLGLAQP